MAYMLADMTWEQVRRHVAGNPVAILPLGSTEQHGPHLPIGTDIMLARHLARLVSDATGALVLPDLAFGYSWVWRDRVGTVGFSQPLLQRALEEVVRSVARWGVRLVVIVNGHEANAASMKYAVRELADEADVRVLGCFYPGWQGVYERNLSSDTWGGMFHADEFETSLMLSARGDLVRMDRAVAEYPHRPACYGMDATSLGALSASGVYGDPTRATVEKGDRMFAAFAETISSLARGCMDEIGDWDAPHQHI